MGQLQTLIDLLTLRVNNLEGDTVSSVTSDYPLFLLTHVSSCSLMMVKAILLLGGKRMKLFNPNSQLSPGAKISIQCVVLVTIM